MPPPLLNKNGDAICMFMRVFIVLMIFLINFSGYSTAAHAFSDVFCDSKSGKQVESTMHCPDHQTSENQKDTGDFNDHSQCPDCVHCCSGHVFNLSLTAPAAQTVFMPIAYPVLSDSVSGDYLFSLLRPPKFAA